MASKSDDNVTDELRSRAFREFGTASRKAKAAAQAASEVSRRFRALGVNMTIIKEMLALRDVDPDEIIALERERLHCLGLLSVPTEQLKLAIGGFDLTEQGRQDLSTWEANDAGVAAGRAGRAIDDNPYQHAPGSPLFVEWRKGWEEGQLEIARGPDAANVTKINERRPGSGRGNKAAAAETKAEDLPDGVA